MPGTDFHGLDWYTTQATYPILNRRHIGDERISNNGNTVTLKNVDLLEGEWLLLELDDKVMPDNGDYAIEVTVDDNPSQTKIISIYPSAR